MEARSSKASLDVGIVLRKMYFSHGGQRIETDRGTLDMAAFFEESPSSPSLTTSRPSSRPHTLFANREWLKRDMKDVLWLPDEYHATDVATLGNQAVMGHASGSISFVRLG